MTLAERIAAVVDAVDLGSPTARKGGRDARFPFVPVVAHAGTPSSPKPRTEQVLGLAYATRAEALAAAALHIARTRADLARRLAEPRHRAMRESYGLPREISEVAAS